MALAQRLCRFRRCAAVVLLVGADCLSKAAVCLLPIPVQRCERSDQTLLPREAYPNGELRLFIPVLDRVSALPGVEAVSVSNGDLPGLEPGWQNDINPEINGQYQKINPGELINVDWSIVSADYLKTMRIPIKQGRTFTAQEVAQGIPVVLVDEQLARASGRMETRGTPHQVRRPRPHTRSSVLPETFALRFPDAWSHQIYTPLGRASLARSTLAVRSEGVAPSLDRRDQKRIQSINSNVPISEIGTLEGRLASHIAPRQFNTWLLGLFATVALLLAAVGIYGVMSYAVTQRTREIGIRIALGAEPKHVLKMTLGQGLRLILIGVSAGLLAALGLTRVMASLLFGGAPLTPDLSGDRVAAYWCFALACYIPARRH